MKTVSIISSSESLLKEVQSHLKGVDGGEAIVVFPGKRPSHFLRKALALERKAGFLPPKILSYDEFIRHLSEELFGVKANDIDALDASAILYEIHLALPEKLGGVHFASFDHFLPLGLKLFDELEELVLAGADGETIRKKIGSLTFGNRHLLATYFDRFYQHVAKEKLVTRSTRLRLVADGGAKMNIDRYQKIILAGFYALTPTDRQIFQSLGNHEQTVLIFQWGPGLHQQMEALGIQAQAAGSPQMDLFGGSSSENAPEAGEPEIHLVKSPDTHGQVFALSARIRELLERKEQLDERTVIVLPSSDALFPVLYESLALLPEEGYNISLGYPLARTPLYGLLRNLLDLVATERDGMVQAAAYTRFILHPYIKNIRFGHRTDVTRVLFHAYEDLLARRPATSVDLASLEEEHALFERVAGGLSDEKGRISPVKLKEHVRAIHNKTIRPFLHPGTLGEFASKMIDLVLSINEDSTAYLHPLFSRYAEKLIAMADAIKGSRAAGLRFDDRTSYAGFLRSYCGPQTVPFPGTPLRGLQVLGLLETRALSFERVFVLDASDDMLPGARGTEMLVPQKIRETLGLETFKDRERLIEYYFSNLIQGAKEVHLFYSENNKQEKSRFIEKLLWMRRKRDKRETGAAHARYRIHLANDNPGPIEKSKEVSEHLKQFEFNTTALDVYLKCQLRFYYQYVLKLREKEEVGEEIEQLDVGNLIHKILKSYFDPFVGKDLKAEELSPERMETVVSDTIEEVFGPHARGSVFLLRQQTIAKLTEFLKDYQKKILESESVAITGLEVNVSVIRDDHHFTGRLDRVERRKEKTVILDYKTRQDDTPQKIRWKKFDPDKPDTWSESIGSLQLPMYSLLQAEHSGESLQNIVPAYVFLGRNYLDKTIETGLSKDGIVTETMQQNLHHVILSLANDIKDPGVPFKPTEDLKKHCPHCPYQTICGTQWAREGRW